MERIPTLRDTPRYSNASHHVHILYQVDRNSLDSTNHLLVSIPSKTTRNPTRARPGVQYPDRNKSRSFVPLLASPQSQPGTPQHIFPKRPADIPPTQHTSTTEIVHTKLWPCHQSKYETIPRASCCQHQEYFYLSWFSENYGHTEHDSHHNATLHHASPHHAPHHC